MKITNKYNLPRSLVSVIKNDPYSAVGDISTTRLISPYQIVALQKKYASELSEDVSDMIYPLIGNNTHHIIERVDTPNTVKEWRFYLWLGGWLMSGKVDLWEDGVLSDWKVTSMWAYVHGLKPEHEAQMNVNAYLIRHSPYSDYLPIDKMQIVMMFRDWSKIKAMNDKTYPKSQIGIQDVPIWLDDYAFHYIYNRIDNHQHCAELPDHELPHCTPEERWEKPTVYKVKSKKRKTSHRNLDSLEKAEAWMESNRKGEYIETVIGESTRCEYYCNVKPFCNQCEKVRG